MRQDAGTGKRYTPLAMGLHWLMAVMIIITFAMGVYMVDLPFDDTRAWFFRHHKNIGLTVGLLLLLRVWWRIRNPAPPMPPETPCWERRAAAISHRLLYIMMGVMPISGFFTTSFTGYPTYFWWIPVDLGKWGGENELANDIFAFIHVGSAYFLAFLVVMHAAAALRHLIIKRDTVFQRMLPGRVEGREQ